MVLTTYHRVFLGTLLKIIAAPLTRIINIPLRLGVVPNELKCAKVIPVFKKGEKRDMDNYCPVSVLSTVFKILEKAVHCQLYKFLSEQKLLSPYQCGFRKYHSTEIAAISFTDSIRREIDQGRLTSAVFIDLRKAFDTVDHDIIINKLRQFGISNTKLAWFQDYLSHRTQHVSIENVQSSVAHITSGVPQGSILGLLLFVLLINVLPSRLTRCKMLMYADDTVLFYSSREVHEIEVTLPKVLEVMRNWINENSLFLNNKKTECVLFGSGIRLNSVTSFTVFIKGTLIKRVSEFKYLGVVLDEMLSWNAHVNYIRTKAGKKIGMLRRIRDTIISSTASILYKSFILPVFDCCDTVWNCCGKVNSETLEKLQRRAASIITRSARNEEALEMLAYDILGTRPKKHVYKLVQKYIAGEVPQFLSKLFGF